MNISTQTIAVPQDQVESGKLFAILSYVVPFFFLIPLIQRENRFAHFHARQVLAFVLLAVLLGVVVQIVPGAVINLIGPVLLLAQIALLAFGIYHAAVGRATQLPVVGPLAERMFAKVNLPQLAPIAAK